PAGACRCAVSVSCCEGRDETHRPEQRHYPFRCFVRSPRGRKSENAAQQQDVLAHSWHEGRCRIYLGRNGKDDVGEVISSSQWLQGGLSWRNPPRYTSRAKLPIRVRSHGGEVMHATQIPSINYWPQNACAKAFWGQHELRPYHHLLSDTLDWVDVRSGDHWLDLGCGCGELTRSLWEKSGGSVAEIVAL